MKQLISLRMSFIILATVAALVSCKKEPTPKPPIIPPVDTSLPPQPTLSIKLDGRDSLLDKTTAYVSVVSNGQKFYLNGNPVTVVDGKVAIAVVSGNTKWIFKTTNENKNGVSSKLDSVSVYGFPSDVCSLFLATNNYQNDTSWSKRKSDGKFIGGFGPDCSTYNFMYDFEGGVFKWGACKPDFPQDPFLLLWRLISSGKQLLFAPNYLWDIRSFDLNKKTFTLSRDDGEYMWFRVYTVH